MMIRPRGYGPASLGTYRPLIHPWDHPVNRNAGHGLAPDELPELRRRSAIGGKKRRMPVQYARVRCAKDLFGQNPCSEADNHVRFQLRQRSDCLLVIDVRRHCEGDLIP
jgi:hypothetical protein